MNRDITLGIVRHVLTTAGGILASRGVLTTSDSDLAVGAIVTLAGIVWSVIEKRSRTGNEGAKGSL